MEEELTALHKICQLLLARNPRLPAEDRAALAPLESLPPEGERQKVGGRAIRVVWRDGQNTLLQTLDSSSGSAPSESDGHPPGLGLRSDAAPRISRRVPHDSRVELRSGLHRPCRKHRRSGGP